MRDVEDENRRVNEAFRVLCESFERNDPKCTEYKIVRPDGYGRRLGEALKTTRMCHTKYGMLGRVKFLCARQRQNGELRTIDSLYSQQCFITSCWDEK
jgi:hypothetical protein